MTIAREDTTSKAVNQDSLLRLATLGIGAFPPSRLHEQASWCWDLGERTGDARYCSLSYCLDNIADLFCNATDGQALTRLVPRLDTLLHVHLQAVLFAPAGRDASLLARNLRLRITREIDHFDQWNDK